MFLKLHKSKVVNRKSKIQITGSKSESNRLLLLQALYPQIKIENLSNSDDSVLMQNALQTSSSTSFSSSISIDIHHAGTAMRFLTAYFSIQKDKNVVITGSSRMKERPIKILVDALRFLGAEISYVENEGYPPIQISGKKLIKNKVTLKANVSSQYISALLLIASKLENGLELSLEGKITSVPYIKMTLSLLSKIGVEHSFVNNIITVKPTTNNQQLITNNQQPIIVESDWSSVSYFYSIVALGDLGAEIELSSYKENSLQGDSVLAKIYKEFGVTTTFNNNSITLQKSSIANHQTSIQLDLNNAPDIAQTIAVTAFGLGLECNLFGLHTLKIKETDRLVALKAELEKLGATVTITKDSLHLKPSATINKDISIATYNDHRMAMAFAPLALKTSIKIQDAKVVSKSYPNFWKDLEHLGFKLNEL